jgi:hypothetical protein
LGRRMGSTSNIKQQVCQFQTVSTEGFTPFNCAHFCAHHQTLLNVTECHGIHRNPCATSICGTQS